MSRINYQNDLFLGLQEIQRMTKFHKDDGYIRLFKSMINNFGIVKVDTDTSFTNFEVTNGTAAGSFKIAFDSYAVDENMDIIYQPIIDNIAITDDNSWYWVKVEYTESNVEEGTVSIAADGTLTGSGTVFGDVLRDQNSYPLKVNFPGGTNAGDYQVVSVLSNTSAVLSGTFAPEFDITYIVVGSFTPGISPAGDDRLPYFYDSCTISLVAEAVADTPPAKTAGTEFYIARVRNNVGTRTIVDKRYLELFSAAQTTEGWVEATLELNFTHTVDREVEYRKNYLGNVELRGSFTVAGGSEAADLLILPAELWPPYTIFGTYAELDESAFGIIVVEDDGTVRAGGSDPFSSTQANIIMNLTYQLE